MKYIDIKNILNYELFIELSLYMWNNVDGALVYLMYSVSNLKNIEWEIER